MPLPNRMSIMNHSAPLPYAENVEVIPSDEAHDISRVVQALKALLQRSRDKTGHFQGDVHVKTHGCAAAELRVLPNLPPELAQGLFKNERTFSAVVRFSNSASQPQADLIPDGRGLAIKVFDVEGDRLTSDDTSGRTQDFVMVNHPVFFARNVKDFLRLEQVLVSADDNPLVTVAQGLTGGSWNPLQWHWREALTAAQIAGICQRILLATPTSAWLRFGSASSWRNTASDPRGFAAQLVGFGIPAGNPTDALRLMLEETLRSQQLLFEFQIQLRTSASSMPIEDATVEWPESESPYRTVALLLIPRQEIDTEQQKAMCRQLAFNVWNALADHRPLGGINRLRREVYPVSAAWRRQEGFAPSQETV